MADQKILETVADIAYYAGHVKYYSGDSRADVSTFICWAKEFEKIHRHTNWEEMDYILTIDEFVGRMVSSYIHLQVS